MGWLGPVPLLEVDLDGSGSLAGYGHLIQRRISGGKSLGVGSHERFGAVSSWGSDSDQARWPKWWLRNSMAAPPSQVLRIF